MKSKGITRVGQAVLDKLMEIQTWHLPEPASWLEKKYQQRNNDTCQHFCPGESCLSSPHSEAIQFSSISLVLLKLMFLFFFLFYYYFFTFFKLFLKYSCLHFFPTTPPTPAVPTSHSWSYPLWFCPSVLYTCSWQPFPLSPHYPLSPPLWLLTVRLFIISMSLAAAPLMELRTSFVSEWVYTWAL